MERERVRAAVEGRQEPEAAVFQGRHDSQGWPVGVQFPPVETTAHAAVSVPIFFQHPLPAGLQKLEQIQSSVLAVPPEHSPSHGGVMAGGFGPVTDGEHGSVNGPPHPIARQAVQHFAFCGTQLGKVCGSPTPIDHRT